MCRAGNIDGLQRLFTDSKLTPLTQDEYGRTLLHVSLRSSLLEYHLLILARKQRLTIMVLYARGCLD